MKKHLPLLGKRILVPRGKKEAKAFSKLVEKYGGVPMEIPLLSFRPIVPSEEMKEIMNQINTYDWIIFTSNVTVETFLALTKIQSDSLPRIAVIGKRTSEVLTSKGYTVDFVPDEYVAEGFVREFLPLVQKGMKVLLPKGNLARDYIAEELTAARAHVDELVVYETYLPEESKSKLKAAISEKQIDILTFTSPSTVDHFMEVINENGLHPFLEDCLISCIGPITKERIESLGLCVHVIPETYTVEDMLKKIINYLEQENKRRN
jgi:uroporphyrinogen-III synthase